MNPKSVATAKIREFSLQQGFEFGYRNREDITTLKPSIMVTGSQNVLTNTFKRIGIRKGYTLDGQRDSSGSGAGIYGSFDWDKHNGTEQNLRVGFNTSGTNGTLQFRYVATAGDKYLTHTFTAGQVYWIDLIATLLPNEVDFCTFWEFTNELKDICLFVDRSSNIFVWSGGVTTIASATANTITKNGTDNWEQAGFFGTATYDRKVLINGTTYTYTGGSATTTLTGVTPSPAAEPANSVAAQAITTVTNATMTGIPAAFKNSLIENLGNQIYVAASDNNSVYVSKVNDFKTYTFASPRLVGEGAILTLDGVPSCLQQQGSEMYMSAGKKYWYETKFTLSSDLKAEALEIIPRKTTSLQAAQSQYLTTKIKNLIAFVSNEVQVNTLGISANFFTDPQVSDVSYSIVNDITQADFTDGHILYFKKYIYLTAPKDGKMFIYNMTQDTTDGLVDTNTHYWEAPQLLPFGKLSIIGGELYGHGYGDSNTYKLFDGYNDDNHFVEAVANFAYDSHGIRNHRKSSDGCYVEGYITSNTKLTLGLQRDLTGSPAEFVIDGSDSQIVLQAADDSSLGKMSLGKVSLGGSNFLPNPLSTPPKFRVIKSYPRTPFFEEQISLSSIGINQQWEIIAVGTNASATTEEPTDINE
jgi:hypothetical protein